jgi:F-type H+-transporting ATPase subunit epsilon
MADTMQFDLVSPERSLVSTQVSSVQIPGADGDFVTMPDHAPVITTLRPGILSVTDGAGSTDYAVSGGFAEVTATGTTVLAEKAMPASEATSGVLDAMIAEAEAAAKDVSGGAAKDASDKLLSDLGVLRAALGV